MDSTTEETAEDPANIVQRLSTLRDEHSFDSVEHNLVWFSAFISKLIRSYDVSGTVAELELIDSLAIYYCSVVEPHVTSGKRQTTFVPALTLIMKYFVHRLSDCKELSKNVKIAMSYQMARLLDVQYFQVSQFCWANRFCKDLIRAITDDLLSNEKVQPLFGNEEPQDRWSSGTLDCNAESLTSSNASLFLNMRYEQMHDEFMNCGGIQVVCDVVSRHPPFQLLYTRFSKLVQSVIPKISTCKCPTQFVTIVHSQVANALIRFESVQNIDEIDSLLAFIHVNLEIVSHLLAYPLTGDVMSLLEGFICCLLLKIGSLNHQPKGNDAVEQPTTGKESGDIQTLTYAIDRADYLLRLGVVVGLTSAHIESKRICPLDRCDILHQLLTHVGISTFSNRIHSCAGILYARLACSLFFRACKLRHTLNDIRLHDWQRQSFDRHQALTRKFPDLNLFVRFLTDVLQGSISNIKASKMLGVTSSISSETPDRSTDETETSDDEYLGISELLAMNEGRSIDSEIHDQINDIQFILTTFSQMASSSCVVVAYTFAKNLDKVFGSVLLKDVDETYAGFRDLKAMLLHVQSSLRIIFKNRIMDTDEETQLLGSLLTRQHETITACPLGGKLYSSIVLIHVKHLCELPDHRNRLTSLIYQLWDCMFHNLHLLLATEEDRDGIFLLEGSTKDKLMVSLFRSFNFLDPIKQKTIIQSMYNLFVDINRINLRMVRALDCLIDCLQLCSCAEINTVNDMLDEKLALLIELDNQKYLLQDEPVAVNSCKPTEYPAHLSYDAAIQNISKNISKLNSIMGGSCSERLFRQFASLLYSLFSDKELKSFDEAEKPLKRLGMKCVRWLDGLADSNVGPIGYQEPYDDSFEDFHCCIQIMYKLSNKDIPPQFPLEYEDILVQILKRLSTSLSDNIPYWTRVEPANCHTTGMLSYRPYALLTHVVLQSIDVLINIHSELDVNDLWKNLCYHMSSMLVLQYKLFCFSTLREMRSSSKHTISEIELLFHYYDRISCAELSERDEPKSLVSPQGVAKQVASVDSALGNELAISSECCIKDLVRIYLGSRAGIGGSSTQLILLRQMLDTVLKLKTQNATATLVGFSLSVLCPTSMKAMINKCSTLTELGNYSEIVAQLRIEQGQALFRSYLNWKRSLDLLKDLSNENVSPLKTEPSDVTPRSKQKEFKTIGLLSATDVIIQMDPSDLVNFAKDLYSEDSDQESVLTDSDDFMILSKCIDAFFTKGPVIGETAEMFTRWFMHMLMQIQTEHPHNLLTEILMCERSSDVDLLMESLDKIGVFLRRNGDISEELKSQLLQKSDTEAINNSTDLLFHCLLRWLNSIPEAMKLSGAVFRNTFLILLSQCHSINHFVLVVKHMHEACSLLSKIPEINANWEVIIDVYTRLVMHITEYLENGKFCILPASDSGRNGDYKPNGDSYEITGIHNSRNETLVDSLLKRLKEIFRNLVCQFSPTKHIQRDLEELAKQVTDFRGHNDLLTWLSSYRIPDLPSPTLRLSKLADVIETVALPSGATSDARRDTPPAMFDIGLKVTMSELSQLEELLLVEAIRENDADTTEIRLYTVTAPSGRQSSKPTLKLRSSLTLEERVTSLSFCPRASSTCAVISDNALTLLAVLDDYRLFKQRKEYETPILKFMWLPLQFKCAIQFKESVDILDLHYALKLQCEKRVFSIPFEFADITACLVNDTNLYDLSASGSLSNGSHNPCFSPNDVALIILPKEGTSIFYQNIFVVSHASEDETYFVTNSVNFSPKLTTDHANVNDEATSELFKGISIAYHNGVGLLFVYTAPGSLTVSKICFRGVQMELHCIGRLSHFQHGPDWLKVDRVAEVSFSAGLLKCNVNNGSQNKANVLLWIQEDRTFAWQSEQSFVPLRSAFYPADKLFECRPFNSLTLTSRAQATDFISILIGGRGDYFLIPLPLKTRGNVYSGRLFGNFESLYGKCTTSDLLNNPNVDNGAYPLGDSSQLEIINDVTLSSTDMEELYTTEEVNRPLCEFEQIAHGRDFEITLHNNDKDRSICVLKISKLFYNNVSPNSIDIGTSSYQFSGSSNTLVINLPFQDRVEPGRSIKIKLIASSHPLKLTMIGPVRTLGTDREKLVRLFFQAPNREPASITEGSDCCRIHVALLDARDRCLAYACQMIEHSVGKCYLQDESPGISSSQDLWITLSSTLKAFPSPVVLTSISRVALLLADSKKLMSIFKSILLSGQDSKCTPLSTTGILILVFYCVYTKDSLKDFIKELTNIEIVNIIDGCRNLIRSMNPTTCSIYDLENRSHVYFCKHYIAFTRLFCDAIDVDGQNNLSFSRFFVEECLFHQDDDTAVLSEEFYFNAYLGAEQLKACTLSYSEASSMLPGEETITVPRTFELEARRQIVDRIIIRDVDFTNLSAYVQANGTQHACNENDKSTVLGKPEATGAAHSTQPDLSSAPLNIIRETKRGLDVLDDLAVCISSQLNNEKLDLLSRKRLRIISHLFTLTPLKVWWCYHRCDLDLPLEIKTRLSKVLQDTARLLRLSFKLIDRFLRLAPCLSCLKLFVLSSILLRFMSATNNYFHKILKSSDFHPYLESFEPGPNSAFDFLILKLLLRKDWTNFCESFQEIGRLNQYTPDVFDSPNFPVAVIRIDQNSAVPMVSTCELLLTVHRELFSVRLAIDDQGSCLPNNSEWLDILIKLAVSGESGVRSSAQRFLEYLSSSNVHAELATLTPVWTSSVHTLTSIVPPHALPINDFKSDSFSSHFRYIPSLNVATKLNSVSGALFDLAALNPGTLELLMSNNKEFTLYVFLLATLLVDNIQEAALMVLAKCTSDHPNKGGNYHEDDPVIHDLLFTLTSYPNIFLHFLIRCLALPELRTVGHSSREFMGNLLKKATNSELESATSTMMLFHQWCRKNKIFLSSCTYDTIGYAVCRNESSIRLEKMKTLCERSITDVSEICETILDDPFFESYKCFALMYRQSGLTLDKGKSNVDKNPRISLDPRVCYRCLSPSQSYKVKNIDKLLSGPDDYRYHLNSFTYLLKRHRAVRSVKFTFELYHDDVHPSKIRILYSNIDIPIEHVLYAPINWTLADTVTFRENIEVQFARSLDVRLFRLEFEENIVTRVVICPTCKVVITDTNIDTCSACGSLLKVCGSCSHVLNDAASRLFCEHCGVCLFGTITIEVKSRRSLDDSQLIDSDERARLKHMLEEMKQNIPVKDFILSARIIGGNEAHGSSLDDAIKSFSELYKKVAKGMMMIRSLKLKIRILDQNAIIPTCAFLANRRSVYTIFGTNCYFCRVDQITSLMRVLNACILVASQGLSTFSDQIIELCKHLCRNVVNKELTTICTDLISNMMCLHVNDQRFITSHLFLKIGTEQTLTTRQMDRCVPILRDSLSLNPNELLLFVPQANTAVVDAICTFADSGEGNNYLKLGTLIEIFCGALNNWISQIQLTSKNDDLFLNDLATLLPQALETNMSTDKFALTFSRNVLHGPPQFVRQAGWHLLTALAKICPLVTTTLLDAHVHAVCQGSNHPDVCCFYTHSSEIEWSQTNWNNNRTDESRFLESITSILQNAILANGIYPCTCVYDCVTCALKFYRDVVDMHSSSMNGQDGYSEKSALELTGDLGRHHELMITQILQICNSLDDDRDYIPFLVCHHEVHELLKHLAGHPVLSSVLVKASITFTQEYKTLSKQRLDHALSLIRSGLEAGQIWYRDFELSFKLDYDGQNLPHYVDSAKYLASNSMFGPLMLDVKNAMCREYRFFSLLEHDDAVRLRVRDKTVSLKLQVRDVYEQIWCASPLLPGETKDKMIVTGVLAGMEDTSSLPDVVELPVASDRDAKLKESLILLTGRIPLFLEILNEHSYCKNVAANISSAIVHILSQCLKSDVLQDEFYSCSLSEQFINVYFKILIQLCQEDYRFMSFVNKFAIADVLEILQILCTRINEISDEDSHKRSMQSLITAEQFKKLLRLSLILFENGDRTVLSYRLESLIPLLLVDDRFFEPFYNLVLSVLPLAELTEKLTDKAEKSLKHVGRLCNMFSMLPRSVRTEKFKAFMYSSSLFSIVVCCLNTNLPMDLTSLRALDSVIGDLIGLLRYICLDNAEACGQLLVLLPTLQALRLEKKFSHSSINAEDLLNLLATLDTDVREQIESAQNSERRKREIATERRKAKAKKFLKLDRVYKYIEEFEQLSHSEIDNDFYKCHVCKEGYNQAPMNALAFYVFVRPLTFLSSSPLLVDASEVTLIMFSYEITIHVSCHTRAVRGDNSSSGWTSAAENNAGARCNNLLPIWSGQDYSDENESRTRNVVLFKDYEHRFANSLTTLCSPSVACRGLRILLAHSLKNLFVRISSMLSMSSDTGGGGLVSNLAVVPYKIILIARNIRETNSLDDLQSDLASFDNQRTGYYATSESLQKLEGPHFWAILRLLLSRSLDDWIGDVSVSERKENERFRCLQQLISVSCAQWVRSNNSDDEIDGPTLYRRLIEDFDDHVGMFKPSMIYFACIDHFMKMLKAVSDELIPPEERGERISLMDIWYKAPTIQSKMRHHCELLSQKIDVLYETESLDDIFAQHLCLSTPTNEAGTSPSVGAFKNFVQWTLADFLH